MKALKIFSIFVLVIFALSAVSALGVVGASWEDGSQSATIVEGESINFTFDAATNENSMMSNINLYDNQNNLIYSFANNEQINTQCPLSDGGSVTCQEGLITIDQSVYQNSGSYELAFRYSDSQGPFSKSIFLTVEPFVETDTNAPEVTITNPVDGNTYTTNQNTLTYTAIDAEDNLVDCRYTDGSFTSQWTTCSGSFGISTQEGLNTFTVEARDSFGNVGSDTISFTIDTGEDDTEAPVITLLGSNPVSVALDSTYTDAGATATDNVDGDITADIVVSNPVDTSMVGAYTITYNVQDAAGNEAEEVTRTVNVFDPSDNEAPIINVLSPVEDVEYDDEDLTFEVEVNEVSEVVFSLNGDSNITMNFAGSSNGTLTFTYEVLNLDDDNHEVTFYATDSAGNTASETIDFSVDTDSDSDDDDDKDKTDNYVNENDFVNDFKTSKLEEEYLNQFKNGNVINLSEEESKSKKGWFQRFIEWILGIFNL